MKQKYLRSAKSAETDDSMVEYLRNVKYGARAMDQKRVVESKAL